MDMLLPITLFSLSFVLAQSRGPHHPRGEPVVKHHVHYRPTKQNPTKITQDSELLHDKEHIQEHLEEIVDEPDLSKMTDEELEFYYFQVHDADKNAKLDGLEILQAIQHTKHHPKHSEGDVDEIKHEDSAGEFEYYVELIDRVLSEDDTDHDGYLSYQEYVIGRKKEMQIEESAKQPEVKMI